MISRSQDTPITINNLVFIINRALSEMKRFFKDFFSLDELCIRKISRFTRLQCRSVRTKRTEFVRIRIPIGVRKKRRWGGLLVSVMKEYEFLHAVVYIFEKIRIQI